MTPITHPFRVALSPLFVKSQREAIARAYSCSGSTVTDEKHAAQLVDLELVLKGGLAVYAYTASNRPAIAWVDTEGNGRDSFWTDLVVDDDRFVMPVDARVPICA